MGLQVGRPIVVPSGVAAFTATDAAEFFVVDHRHDGFAISLDLAAGDRPEVTGLKAGATFAYPSEGCPSLQASHFWSVAGGQIKADGKSIMPMVDDEEFSGVGCSEGSYTTWYNDWSADLKTHTSLTLRPIIYTSACSCSVSSAITLSAWIANYNGENLYTGNPWNECTSCNVWGGSN